MSRHLSSCRLQITTLLFCLALAGLLYPSQAGAESLRIFADPPRIQADGRSTTVIIAQVQDDLGAPAAEGTTVSFTTSLGSITSASNTRGGVARAVLTSGSSAGTAIVSVMAAGIRQEIEVEFTSEGGETQGKEVAYSREAGLASVNEGGRFEYGAIRITAEAIQCDLNGSQLSAQGNVEISNGETSLLGCAVVYAPRRGQGSLLRYEEDQPVIYSFQAPGLQVKREESADLSLFRPLEEQPSRTLIITRRVQVLPDGQTVFDEADILVDGVRLLSLPHYALSPANGERELIEQAVTFETGSGLAAEFPYYYIAKPGRIGSLHITHNMGAPGILGRSGLGLSLEEQYFLGDRASGKVNIDDLASDSRGLRWSHSQQFSGTLRAFSSLRYARYGGDSPRSLDADATISKSLPKISVDLSLHSSNYSDFKSQTAILSARTRSRTIGRSGFSYSNGLRLSYSVGTVPEVITVSEEETLEEVSSISSETRASFAQSISLQVNSPQWRLGGKTSFSSTFGLSNNWYAGSPSQSLTASASLRRKIGKDAGSLGLTYSGFLQSVPPEPFLQSVRQKAGEMAYRGLWFIQPRIRQPLQQRQSGLLPALSADRHRQPALGAQSVRIHVPAGLSGHNDRHESQPGAHPGELAGEPELLSSWNRLWLGVPRRFGGAFGDDGLWLYPGIGTHLLAGDRRPHLLKIREGPASGQSPASLSALSPPPPQSDEPCLPAPRAPSPG
jgi:hypothetical protein